MALGLSNIHEQGQRNTAVRWTQNICVASPACQSCAPMVPASQFTATDLMAWRTVPITTAFPALMMSARTEIGAFVGASEALVAWNLLLGSPTPEPRAKSKRLTASSSIQVNMWSPMYSLLTVYGVPQGDVISHFDWLYSQQQ